MKSFDRVAGIYQALEYLAFGRALERARLRYVERLRDRRHVLIVGEGDGRFLERLLAVAPQARVRCVDSSAAMLARAAGRLDPAARARVEFECADVRVVDIPPRTYDAVVTMFVLDCLSAAEVTGVVRRLAGGLQREGVWLFADFAIPARGWRRLRAELWVGTLYLFFRWQTGLGARELPPSEDILRDAGFRLLDSTTLQQGLLRSAVYVPA
jgi:ubiquinone/menaquinone biosynthesis C-methylase UbiE